MALTHSSKSVHFFVEFPLAIQPSPQVNGAIVNSLRSGITAVNDVDQSTESDAPETLESEEALKQVYAELRDLAKRQIASERADHTLQATSLVHEAWLRIATPNAHWNSREHFVAAAAEAMRRVLIDHARRKQSQKRGGGAIQVTLGSEPCARTYWSDELVALDESLSKLAERDAAKAKLVELRFFAGMTNSEAAAALNISESTAERWWAYSRAWLQNAMKG